MTVHAVLILVEETPLPDHVSDVRDEHATHAEALPEQATEFSHVEADPLMGTPAHGHGVYRYQESEDKAALLDGIETAIPGAASWYALYYHSCDHDLPSDMRTGCPGWTAERASGTVPTEVRP